LLFIKHGTDKKAFIHRRASHIQNILITLRVFHSFLNYQWIVNTTALDTSQEKLVPDIYKVQFNLYRTHDLYKYSLILLIYSIISIMIDQHEINIKLQHLLQ